MPTLPYAILESLLYAGPRDRRCGALARPALEPRSRGAHPWPRAERLTVLPKDPTPDPRPAPLNASAIAAWSPSSPTRWSGA